MRSFGAASFSSALRAEQVVQQLAPGVSTGHIRSSASRISGSARTRVAHVRAARTVVVAPRGRHRRPHLALDPPAGRVVAAEPTLRSTHDALRLLGAQAQEAGAERHDDVVAQRPLAIGDRLVDDVGHPQVALDGGGQRAVGGVDAVARPLDVGHEVVEHHLLDAGLAQRRQHALDVAQEHPVRADDEHALVLEREAVRVQQVRGAVQRHDGLAGARAALHHQHARPAGCG